ncbi:MAG: transporter [Hyphomicrobiales bacterium]|nr:transporter [Hyphomicrobiales bacterium]
MAADPGVSFVTRAPEKQPDLAAAPHTARPKVWIEGVMKSYSSKAVDNLLALRDVNLQVRPGEFISLLGPSGCGKTTLLKIIAGLVPFDSGRVDIDRDPVTEPSSKVAMVFQNFGLFPWRTVRGNVEFGLEAAGVPGKLRRETAEEYINLVGLGRFSNSHPSQLSGGMQQRVGLARALAVRPEILLMDEPFGALDAHTRELLQFEMLSILQKTQATIILVTHSVDEALVLSDRIAVFSPSPGHIMEVLDVDLPHPRDAAVKSLPRYAAMRQHIWDALRPVAKKDDAS